MLYQNLELNNASREMTLVLALKLILGYKPTNLKKSYLTIRSSGIILKPQ